jgi:trehalose-6-phosphatase
MEAKAVSAVKKLGFKTFGDYLETRTGRTLIEMAEELGVNSVTFIAYHGRWMRAKLEGSKENVDEQ